MISCKNESTALAASCAPPIKSSRNKATTPSSSTNTGGEACDSGRLVIAERKVALRHSYIGQCKRTWFGDSTLSGSPQAGQMRSSVSCSVARHADTAPTRPASDTRVEHIPDGAGPCRCKTTQLPSRWQLEPHQCDSNLVACCSQPRQRLHSSMSYGAPRLQDAALLLT